MFWPRNSIQSQSSCAGSLQTLGLLRPGLLKLCQTASRPISVFTDPHLCLPVLPLIQQSAPDCLCPPSTTTAPINIASLHSGEDWGAKNLDSDWYQSNNCCPKVIYYNSKLNYFLVVECNAKLFFFQTQKWS